MATSPMGPPVARMDRRSRRAGSFGVVAKLRMRKQRLADAAFGDPFADKLDAGVVAHVLRNSEDDSGGASGKEHLLDFGGVQRQRLFA